MRKLILTILFCFICSVGFADTVTYYFNAYDSGGEEWDFAPGLPYLSPAYMTDNDLNTYAASITNNQVHLLTANTCDGTDLGTISKVEIRANGGSSTGPTIRPVFSGGDGDGHTVTLSTEASVWSSYVDITSDTNAPATWSWSNVQNLDCDIVNLDVTGATVAKVEIRVTYTAGGGGGWGGKIYGISLPANVNGVETIANINGVE